jgi:tight adherence protein C
VAAAVVAGVLVAPHIGVLAGGVLLAMPHLRARAARRREEATIVDRVPDVIDLLRLAVDAGLGAGEALTTVADHLPAAADGDDPVATALRRLRLRVARGDRLADTLAELDALGEPARALREALLATHRYGVPLTPALQRAGEDARDVRRRRREELAKALPVKLFLPLLGCTLPAVLLLTFAPVAVRALPSLAP